MKKFALLVMSIAYVTSAVFASGKMTDLRFSPIDDLSLDEPCSRGLFVSDIEAAHKHLGEKFLKQDGGKWHFVSPSQESEGSDVASLICYMGLYDKAVQSALQKVESGGADNELSQTQKRQAACQAVREFVSGPGESDFSALQYLQDWFALDQLKHVHYAGLSQFVRQTLLEYIKAARETSQESSDLPESDLLTYLQVNEWYELKLPSVASDPSLNIIAALPIKEAIAATNEDSPRSLSVFYEIFGVQRTCWAARDEAMLKNNSADTSPDTTDDNSYYAVKTSLDAKKNGYVGWFLDMVLSTGSLELIKDCCDPGNYEHVFFDSWASDWDAPLKSTLALFKRDRLVQDIKELWRQMNTHISAELLQCKRFSKGQQFEEQQGVLKELLVKIAARGIDQDMRGIGVANRPPHTTLIDLLERHTGLSKDDKQEIKSILEKNSPQSQHADGVRVNKSRGEASAAMLPFLCKLGLGLGICYAVAHTVHSSWNPAQEPALQG